MKYKLLKRFEIFIVDRFRLNDDKADDETIDQRIRLDVIMRGSNLWILIFAILIASIGLNVNSTAVIIGAMLISPLMGPIIGMGYGVGINDYGLLRYAFQNLLTATMIALLASALYFMVTPLDMARSELLARTTPTIWDVLIAFFGGLAGIIGITRKEKSNVIPGVAIATALMPPLCTAGFGLATWNLSYFFGAFYLYVINFVFITIAVVIIVRVFNISEKKYIETHVAKKAQGYIVFIAIVTIIPSTYLAYILVSEEVFKVKAKSFVNHNFDFNKTNVAQIKIDPKAKELKVFLIGEHIKQQIIDEASLKMISYGLQNSTLKVYQNGEQEIPDMTTLGSDIAKEIYNNSQSLVEAKNYEIQQLRSELNLLRMNNHDFETIPKEIEALFPSLQHVLLSKAVDFSNEQNSTVSTLVLNADSTHKLTSKDLKRLERWLKERTKMTRVIIKGLI